MLHIYYKQQLILMNVSLKHPNNLAIKDVCHVLPTLSNFCWSSFPSWL